MLLIRGGTVVGPSGPSHADVRVHGERIVEVGPNLQPEGADVVDASGALVVPGAIDVHTHFDLQVGVARSADDFETGTVAAACGGTTCVIDFAGTGRESPGEALEVWHEKARSRAVVDYGFHLTVTVVPESPAEARRLFEGFVDTGVTSVKLYLAYPDRLMVDEGTLARALRAGAETGVLVCVHAEDGAEVERLTADALAAGEWAPDTLARTRPPKVEAAAVRRAGELAAAAGATLYVVHLSSEAGLQAVIEARVAGATVWAETCPHYLFLTEDLLRGPADTADDFVCTPPIRAATDLEALWRAVADGNVQVVATDHCPFTIADRAGGTKGGGWQSFAEIPGGLPGVETRLSLAYQGVRSGRISIERWVDATASAPARLFGLAHRKGSIAPGMDADVVVFDPAASPSLEAADLHMRTDHSPYAGLEVRGWPALTLSRGRVVARAGDPVAAPGWGVFVRRRAGARN